MSKLLIVAWQEYSHQVRRKGFLLATFGIPLGLILLIAVIVVIAIGSEQVSTIGYVDQAGLLSELGEQTVVAPPPSDQGELGEPDVTAIRYQSEQAGRAALDAGTIEALFVVPADYQTSGVVTGYAPQSVPQVAERRFGQLLRRALIAELGGPALRLEDPIAEGTALTREGTPYNPFIGFVLPFIFGIMMVISSFSSSTYLMQSLVEEKENRLLEILATSITPGGLMGGKILGLGLLGLTQFAIWVAAAGVALTVARRYVPALADVAIPWSTLLPLLALFVPNYLLMAATLSALGATVTATQEGQQMASFSSILTFFPFWFMAVLLQNPNGPLALALSIFPYSAPITLLIRSMTSEVPAWQYALTSVLLVGAALGMTWLAGRLLRYSMLRAGQRLGLRHVRQALREV